MGLSQINCEKLSHLIYKFINFIFIFLIIYKYINLNLNIINKKSLLNRFILI